MTVNCKSLDDLPAMLTAAELAGGPGYLQGGGLCPDPQEGLSNPANRETAHGAKGQTDGLDRPADSRGRGTGVTCVRDVSKHWICATNPLEQGCPPATPGGEEERR